MTLDTIVPRGTLSEQFKQARLTAGLSRARAAALLYVSPDCVYKWESDHRSLPRAMLELFLIKIEKGGSHGVDS